MLRVHHLHAQRGQPIVHCSKRADVVDEAHLPRVALVDLARARVVVELVVPAILRDLGEAHPRFPDVLPVGAEVGRLGEAGTHADDGDIRFHLAGFI